MFDHNKMFSKIPPSYVKGLYVLLAKGFGALISMLMTWAISLYLGAEGAGIFFLAFTLVTILSIIARLGFDNIALRETAIFLKNKNKKDTYYLLLVRLMLVSIIFTLLTLLFSDEAATLLFGVSSNSDVISIMCLAIFPIAAYHLNAYSLQGSGRPIQFAIINNILFPLFILAVVLSFRHGISLIILALSVTLIALVVYIYSRTLLIRAVPEYRSGPLMGRLEKEIITSSRQFITISLANMCTSWLLILILGLYLTPSDVGIYNVAFRLSFTISFFLVSVVIVAAPKFVVLHANNEIKKMEVYARMISRAVFVLSLVPIVLMLLVPEYILSLFGSEFVQGKSVLQILAIGQLINIGMGPVQSIINMTKNEKYLKSITLETSILSLVIALVTIPHFGIEGGAFAYATAIAVQNIRSYLVVKKELRIRVSPFSFA